MGVTCFCNFFLSRFPIVISRFGLFNILDSECSMPKATDDTCLSDLERKMGSPHALREAGETYFGGNKMRSKVAGKVRSIAPSNHPKWLEP